MSKTKFYFATSIAALFACSFSCGQQDQHKGHTHDKSHHGRDTADATVTTPPIIQDQTINQSKDVNGISSADLKRVSEAFGHFIGRNLKTPGINFDLDSIIQGMRDGYAGKPAPMADKEYEALMTKVQEQAYKQLSTTNLKAANDYLEKNAKEKNVVQVVPNKLQYIILQEGTGPAVTEHGSPQIKYTGKFIDGTVFGNSDDVGGSITIPLDQTIPGFSKGIVGMKEGEKRRLFVHPDVGYGTSGHLPPNSLLIFDIELQKVQGKEDADEDDKDSALEDDLALLLSDQDSSEDDEDDDYDHDRKGPKKTTETDTHKN